MILLEPPRLARRAGLIYMGDDRPGVQRVRCGSGFRYRMPDGRFLARGDEHRAWIESLAIPPAWEGVWICPDRDGHLQATGRDARGRKQYRYHPAWMELRNRTKFDQLPSFAEALPRVRRRVSADLELPGLPARKVIACAIRLLDRTLIRVGNPEYARDNETFGLTTLRHRHVAVAGRELLFRFRSKSGRERELALDDPRAARVVRRCQELPNHELFSYLDAEGELHDLRSTHVNEYLDEVAGEGVTAKDFRTWGGTVVAAETLAGLGPLDADSPARAARELKRREIEAVRAAAGVLGNTVATCRKYYVHPDLAPAHATGALARSFEHARTQRAPSGLRLPERAVLDFLEG